jgi:hypothetical protein
VASIISLFVDHPATVLNTKKTTLALCKTITLPYISDSGASTNGPIAYARRKMDMKKYDSISERAFRSSARTGRAGASIVLATGEMNVKQDTKNVAVHLRLRGQFLGFAGSVSESQVTYAALVVWNSREVNVRLTRCGLVDSSFSLAWPWFRSGPLDPCISRDGSFRVMP